LLTILGKLEDEIMKHYSQVLAFFILFNIISPIYCFSQEWEWQNPLPTGNRIYCMDFVNEKEGWVFGSNGAILHATTGGQRVWR